MIVRFGEHTFDAGRRLVLRQGQTVHLSPKAFELLKTLLASRPRAVSKSDLMDALWPESLVTEATLASLVSELRTALGDDAKKPRFIRTAHGFGYAFEDEGGPPHAARAIVHRLTWGTREIALVEGANAVGRDPEAPVFLLDGSVSRRHATIVVRGEEAVLEDHGSKNATYRGSERLHGSVVLADGDELRFGTVGVTYRRVSVAGSTVTRAKRDS